MGNSFGAMTALETARVSSKVKGVIAMDPWFFPSDCGLGKGNESNSLIVMTERFC